MYFINSGRISVETLGSVVKRGPGDFFGEGAVSEVVYCLIQMHTYIPSPCQFLFVMKAFKSNEIALSDNQM